MKVIAPNGGTVEIRNSNLEGKIVAILKIPPSSNWKEIPMPILKSPKGIQNLFAILKDNKMVELDWIKFR